MADLTITAEDPSGTGRDVYVSIVLVDANKDPVNGYTSTGAVVASWTGNTGTDGTVTVDVTPNADVTPANTYYLVTVNHKEHLVDMPDSASDLGDVLADDPSALDSAAIAAHVAAKHGYNTKYLSTYSGCDETGATDSAAGINTAIAAAAAANQTLVVDGHFLCSSELTLVAGTRLVGLGWDQSILEFDWSLQSVDDSYLQGSSLADVHISGLEIRGDGDGTPWGSNADSGACVAGIRLVECTDVTLRDIRYYRVPGLNQILVGCQRVQVDGCEFRQGGRDGLHIAHGTASGGTLDATDIAVMGCTFHDMGDDCIAVWPGGAGNGTTVTVATTSGSSTVTGTGFVSGDVGSLMAIDGADGGVAATGAVFEATIATYVSATEITLDRVVPTTIASASARYGFSRNKRITISGCTILQRPSVDALSAGRGIVLSGCEDVSITGCTVADTHGTGIEFGEGDPTLVYAQNVTISGCTVSGAGTMDGGTYAAGLHGVRLGYGRGLSLSDCTVTESVKAGIAVAECADSVISGCVVLDNGTESGGYGINIDGVSGERACQRNMVAGCVVRRSYDAGIRVNYGNGSVVADCVVTDNATNGALGTGDCGIVLRGDGTVHVRGNICTDTRPSGDKTQRLGILTADSVSVVVVNNVCTSNNASPGISYGASVTIRVAANNVASLSDEADNADRVGTILDVVGAGSPEGVVTGGVGSVFRRSDGAAGTTMYVKVSGTGNTGWVAVGGGDTVDAARVAAKTADQTKVSDNTLADDADLTLSVSASSRYIVEAYVVYDAHATPDIKIGWSVPAGATMWWTPNITSGNAQPAVAETGTHVGGGAAGTKRLLWCVGLLVTDVTAGNLAVQWAQNTSDVNNTTVLNGSWLRIAKTA